VAYTLAKKRSVLSSRVFAVAQSSADLSNLSKLASKPIRVAQPRDPGFIFTGQGAQYSKMGAQLLDYPIFKKSMDNAAAYFRRKGASWNLLGKFQLREYML
jgi:acyl transferase domain-containing protein